MKYIFLIIFSISCHIDGFSQTILDFFESVPDSSLVNLTAEKRKTIVKLSADNKSEDDAINDLMESEIDYSFSVVDLKNGYLKLIGAFPGHIQMCYWNMENGNKLIAIYIEGCGPVCYVAQFDFYEYDGLQYNPIDRQNIIPEIYNDFFGEDRMSKIEAFNSEDIIATVLFDLPRNGKNIIAKWGNEESQNIYKKYVIGNRMHLIWNDGYFFKGDIFWK